MEVHSDLSDCFISRDPTKTPQALEFSPQNDILEVYSVRSSEEWWWDLELFRDCLSDFTEILSCAFGHSYFAKEDEKPTVAKAEDEAIVVLVGFADGISSLFWRHHIEKAMSSEWKHIEIERWWWPMAFHPQGTSIVFLGSFIQRVDVFTMHMLHLETFCAMSSFCLH